jgi:Cytosine/adenosine deaminases
MDYTNDDEKYMRMAIREAQKAFDEKEIPIGCVIVKDGVVIGRGHNQIEMLKDATAHAEILSSERQPVTSRGTQGTTGG